MSTHTLLIIETAIGALLLAFILLDVFLTVLYARIGYGILSARIARSTWLVYRGVSKPFRRCRGRILSFCGPTILVMLVAGWAFTLSLGAGLIVHQRLGTSIKPGSGQQADRNFITALFVGNASLSIVSSSGYAPNTPATRLLYVFDSIAGASVLSLTLTYLMQVYSALNARSAMALEIHLGSNETGDAAELIAGFGTQGRFDAASRTLDQISSEMTQMKETHNLFPVLFYFRFAHSYYAVSRFSLVALDAAALLRTALADDYEWLKESGSVTGLGRSSMLLVQTLGDNFLSERIAGPATPDAATEQRWRERFRAAIARLQKAGIKTTSDPEAGVRKYIELRAQWQPYIEALAKFLVYDMKDIDPVMG